MIISQQFKSFCTSDSIILRKVDLMKILQSLWRGRYLKIAVLSFQLSPEFVT